MKHISDHTKEGSDNLIVEFGNDSKVCGELLIDRAKRIIYLKKSALAEQLSYQSSRLNELNILIDRCKQSIEIENDSVTVLQVKLNECKHDEPSDCALTYVSGAIEESIAVHKRNSKEQSNKKRDYIKEYFQLTAIEEKLKLDYNALDYLMKKISQSGEF